MKAILIFDMPKDCYECPLEHDRKCLGIVVCEKVESLDRPKWCPLKPLPNKEPEYFISSVNGEEVHDVYFQGWNDCIDKIMEKENGKTN